MDFTDNQGDLASKRVSHGICKPCGRYIALKFSLSPLPIPSESWQHRNNDVSNLASVISDINETEKETARLDQEIAYLEGALSSFEGRRVNLLKCTTLEHETSRIASMPKFSSGSVPFGICGQCLSSTELKLLSSPLEKDFEPTVIDQETFRLENALTTLKNRRGELQQFEINQKSLLAPIRKLPADVLSYVFLTCHCSSMAAPGFTSNSSAIIHKLERVCRYWRSIIRSSPNLWSHIDVIHMPSVPSMQSYLRNCIALSREAPLTIKLPYTLKTLSDACIQALAGCAHRFQHLLEIHSEVIGAIDSHLSLSTSVVGFNMLKTLSLALAGTDSAILPSMPILTHLTVYTLKCMKPEEVFPITITFKAVPSITHLELERLRSPQNTLLDFPWAQITHLTTIRIAYKQGELSALLQIMKDLNFYSLADEIPLQSRIILPNLRTLKLNWIKNLSNTLRYLIAPNLKILDVDDNSASDVGIISDFALHSGCNLDELVLRNASLNEQWRVKQFSGVKKLTLQWNLSFTLRSNLNWLDTSVSGGEPGLFPRLEALTING